MHKSEHIRVDSFKDICEFENKIVEFEHVS